MDTAYYRRLVPQAISQILQFSGTLPTGPSVKLSSTGEHGFCDRQWGTCPQAACVKERKLRGEFLLRCQCDLRRSKKLWFQERAAVCGFTWLEGRGRSEVCLATGANRAVSRGSCGEARA